MSLSFVPARAVGLNEADAFELQVSDKHQPGGEHGAGAQPGHVCRVPRQGRHRLGADWRGEPLDTDTDTDTDR